VILFYPAELRLRSQVEQTCPGGSIDFGADGKHPVFTPPPGAPPSQVAAAQKVIDDFVTAGDWRIYRTRLITDIYNDIRSLTALQTQHLTTDLYSGTPMKALLDTGYNAAAIAALLTVRQCGFASQAADRTIIDRNVFSQYAADNPTYLLSPSWDTTISVPGWEPIP